MLLWEIAKNNKGMIGLFYFIFFAVLQNAAELSRNPGKDKNQYDVPGFASQKRKNAMLGKIGDSCPLFPLFAYTIWIKKLTKGFIVSTEKLTINEYATNVARSRNLTTLWICEILFLLLVTAGIFIITTSPKDWFTGILSILLFGFFSYIGGKMIKSKKTIKST